MTPGIISMARQAAIAWSDFILGMDQRYSRARERILAEKGYGTEQLMRDVLESWMQGMEAWDRSWLGYRGAATGTPAPGPSTPAIPTIVIKWPALTGEAKVAPPTGPAPPRCTSLRAEHGTASIPSERIAAHRDGEGVLTVRISDPTHLSPAPGVYKAIVFVEDGTNLSLLAHVTLEVAKA